MDYDKQKLISIFHETGAIQRGKFVLSSEMESDYYIDAKKALLDSRALQIVCRWFWSLACKMEEGFADLIGGAETGSNHIIGGILATAPIPISSFILRKKPKEHGTQKLVEGFLSEKRNIILVEDVITTGNSILKVLDHVKSVGSWVTDIYAVVDRSGGQFGKKLAERSYADYHSLLTVEELLA